MMCFSKWIHATLANVMSASNARLMSKKPVLLGLTLLVLVIGPSSASSADFWVTFAKNCLKDACGAGMGSIVGPVGALCGGCAATLSITVAPPPDNTGSSVTSNPKNSLDWVGAKHNELVRDYLKENKSFNIKTFYQFTERNKQRYRIDTMPSIEEVTKAVEGSGDKNASVEDLLKHIDNQFKTAGIKQDIVGRLRPFFVLPKLPGPTFPEWEASILQIENDALQAKDLNKQQVQHLSAFFAVLRNSGGLWFDSAPAK